MGETFSYFSKEIPANEPNFEMDVRTISSSKTITAELNINVETIEYITDKKIFGGKNYLELPFTIFLKDGTNYNGDVTVLENTQIELCIHNAKTLR